MPQNLDLVSRMARPQDSPREDFSREQVLALIPQQKPGRRKCVNSIRDKTKKINNAEDMWLESQLLIDTNKPIATSSRLSLFRRELRELNASPDVIDATRNP